MVFKFIYLVIIVMSIMFSQVVHPMLLAYLVLIGGVMVMLILGYIFPLFWLSYIILLTFLGGLLVLFIYVASLSPNEPVLSFSSGAWLLVVSVLFFSLWWESGLDIGYYLSSDYLLLSKMYLGGMGFLMTILVIYLFLVLLVVVDLSFVIMGPLKVMYD